MTLSSGKSSIPAGARGAYCPVSMRACSLIVPLALVCLLTIIHEPTLVISAEATTTSNPANITNTTTTTTSSNTTAAPISSSAPNATDAKQTVASTPASASGVAETTSQVSAFETSTLREPTEQEINEARKIIQEVASTIQGTNPHRLAMNKPAAPVSSPLFVEYAPDSPEARVSEATSHFGLGLMRAISLGDSASATTTTTTATATATDRSQQQANTVVSPLSLQILLNIILLGTKDQSLSQAELAKVLGYGSGELSLKASEKEDANSTSVRLGRPHKALHSVVDSIMKATHLSINDRHLLNTDPTIATSGESSSNEKHQQQQFQAHLQTTTRDGDTALTNQVNFTLANLMLTNKDLVETRPEYERDLKKYYNIKVEQFSRQQDASGAAGKQLKLHERVNDWVRNITQNQITDLADESSLADERLLLVLLNAAHFKGSWLHTFNSRLTQDRVFYNNGQKSAGVEAKFMRQNGMFGYAEFTGEQQRQGADADDQSFLGYTEPKSGPDELQSAPRIELSKEESRRLELTAKIRCSALSLPFALNDGQEMSMVVLLPSRADGLDELLESLSVEVLNEIYRSLSDQQVQVELPKFNIEASHDVKSMLEKLGLERIFGHSAELERMFGASAKRPARVDKIIHKAKITVDEQGAEAAAASMATVVLRSAIKVTTPNFLADHPFLYIIRHNRSNMPLFMGQVRRF